MDQWEYHIVTFPKFLHRKYTEEQFLLELNKLGEEGWELASSSIPTNSNALISIFKRKKRNTT
ncbi:MAG: DUF4177 domain-containing protein [Aureispira sp.]|nr:DUF4177 domain-containing protein [Aureispira sp.]